jgi:hypothetical protein
MSSPCLTSGHAEHGAATRAPEVNVRSERMSDRGVVQKHALARAERVSEEGLRKILPDAGGRAHPHVRRGRVADGFRNPLHVIALWNQQDAPLGTGVFDGDRHEHVVPLVEDDLPREGLRKLDDGRPVETIDGCIDGRGGGGRGRGGPEVRVKSLELPDLSRSTPAQVGRSGALQVDARDRLDAARHVEPGGKFAGGGLVLNEAALARRPNRLVVETFGFQLTALQTRELRPDQRGSIFEVLRTDPRPCFQFPVVRDQSRDMARVFRGVRRIAGRRPREGRVEMVLHVLEERPRRPEALFCLRASRERGRRVVGPEACLHLAYPVPAAGHDQVRCGFEMTLVPALIEVRIVERCEVTRQAP